MYEITLMNRTTGEEAILFGYTVAKAMDKGGYTKEEWTVIDMEYVD